MAALDENCKFFGLILLQLMENAGAKVASEIKKHDVVVIGMGLGAEEAIKRAARLINNFLVS